MFLYVVTVEEKEKLLKLGYKYIKIQYVGDKNIYMFEDNKKLKFDKCDVNVGRTNKLYFEGR